MKLYSWGEAPKKLCFKLIFITKTLKISTKSVSGKNSLWLVPLINVTKLTSSVTKVINFKLMFDIISTWWFNKCIWFAINLCCTFNWDRQSVISRLHAKKIRPTYIDFDWSSMWQTISIIPSSSASFLTTMNKTLTCYLTLVLLFYFYVITLLFYYCYYYY